MTTQQRLTSLDEQRLGREIEAGVLAQALLERRPGLAAEPTDPDRRAELAALVEQGRLARERFLLANLGLVGLVSRRSAARHDLSSDDLFQEGFLGLVAAVERFDYQRGCRFSTYAMSWIRCYVDRAVLTRLDSIELPPGRISRIRRLQRLQAELSQRHGREVGLGETAEQVEQGHDLARDSLWLVPSGWNPLESLDPPAPAVPESSAPGREMLAVLPPPQRDVVWCRFGFGGTSMSRRQTAHQLGLSTSQVRRLEEKALTGLRREYGEADLFSA